MIYLEIQMDHLAVHIGLITFSVFFALFQLVQIFYDQWEFDVRFPTTDTERLLKTIIGV